MGEFGVNYTDRGTMLPTQGIPFTYSYTKTLTGRINSTVKMVLGGFISCLLFVCFSKETQRTHYFSERSALEKKLWTPRVSAVLIYYLLIPVGLTFTSHILIKTFNKRGNIMIPDNSTNTINNDFHITPTSFKHWLATETKLLFGRRVCP